MASLLESVIASTEDLAERVSRVSSALITRVSRRSSTRTTNYKGMINEEISQRYTEVFTGPKYKLVDELYNFTKHNTVHMDYVQHFRYHGVNSTAFVFYNRACEYFRKKVIDRFRSVVYSTDIEMVCANQRVSYGVKCIIIQGRGPKIFYMSVPKLFEVSDRFYKHMVRLPSDQLKSLPSVIVLEPQYLVNTCIRLALERILAERSEEHLFPQVYLAVNRAGNRTNVSVSTSSILNSFLGFLENERDIQIMFPALVRVDYMMAARGMTFLYQLKNLEKIFAILDVTLLRILPKVRGYLK